MIIREFSIDRFGMLAGQRVSALSPGITIFYGDNEAGKSTCLNFFRAMLFGYARNRRSIDYLADAKNLSGGSLLIDSESLGMLRLGRVPGPHGGKLTLTGADGVPRPESDLAVLLRGCTSDLFDKVFAFSLGELMQFSSLTDDNIRHALHGAAFGSGLRSPGQVLKELEEAMRRLFAPRASTSKIHGLLREFDEVNAVIRDRGNEADRYTALREELELTERELASSVAARRILEDERRNLELALRLRRRWESVREAEYALAAFPEIKGSFTPDGRERLDRLAERLEDRRHTLAKATFALERVEAECASLAFDPALVATLGPVRALTERKESMRAAAGEARSLSVEHEALSRRIAEICTNLGPGWDADRMETADISLAANAQCESLGHALTVADQARNMAKSEAERLEREEYAARQSWEEAALALREVGMTAPEGMGTPSSAPPSEDELERLSQLLVRGEDAYAGSAYLALAERNAEQAYAEAVAAIDPDWSREDFERVGLSASDRERMLALARSVGETAVESTEREREKKSAALLHDDVAYRSAMLERSIAERFARIFCRAEKSTALNDPATSLEDADARLEHSRRVVRRAQGAHKTLEVARATYDTANEQLGDTVSLLRGARQKSSFPWATLVLFLAALCAVCGGGLLYLNPTSGKLLLFGFTLSQETMARIWFGLLASGLAFGLAWLAIFANGGADSAAEAMEQNWSAIEQRLIRTRATAQNTKLEAEDALENLTKEAPDLFPTGVVDADAIAEAEQNLAWQREQFIVLEREVKDLERENSTMGAAAKHLEYARAAWQTASQNHADTISAWSAALERLHLPATVSAQDARFLFERLDAAAICRSALLSRLAEKQAAEDHLAECRNFAITLPELADAFASLPEPGSHLAPDPGPWLAMVREFISRQRRAGRERIRLSELAEMRRDRLDEITILKAGADVALETASSKYSEALDAWRSWLNQQHFVSDLSPETTRRALETVSKGKTVLETLHGTERRGLAIKRDVAAFLHDLAPLADLAPDIPFSTQLRSLAAKTEFFQAEFVLENNLAPIPDASTMAEALSFLDNLAERVRDAGEKAAVARAGEKELPALRDAVTLAEEDVSATQKAIEAMLALAQCATPEEYRSAHASWERRQTASAALRTASATLERETSEANLPLEDLVRSFASSNAEEDAERIKAHEDALGQALAGEHAIAERKGGLEAEMKALLGEKDITDLLARKESLAGEIRSLGREWSCLALAREMLLTAKGRFESERQGGVVRYAGEIFSAVTQGAYKSITVSLADESVAAVTREGALKNPETELSRGTREQLYLALRLAYVMDHGAQAEKLPVVMDDILVNFDDDRTRQTISVLASFAAAHQVLFFTCHPRTADMLEQAAPSTIRYALQNGNFILS